MNWKPCSTRYEMLWLRQMRQQINKAAQSIPADVLPVCHSDRLLEGLTVDAEKQLRI